MWNFEKSTNLINKIAQLYGEEIIYDRSNSVESLAAYLDEMVANIMHIDKNIITTARKWLKIIERAAISDGIDKVEQILNQEERQTTTQILEDIVETKEIEMLTEPKTYSNHEEAPSEKTVEIEMELKKEDSQPDLSISKMNLIDLDLLENLQKIKPKS